MSGIRERETSILYAISSKLTAALTPTEQLDAVSDYARDGGAISALLLHVESHEQDQPMWLEVIAAWNENPAIPPCTGKRYAIANQGINHTWLAHRPTLIEDITTTAFLDPITREICDQVQARALAILPLTAKGRWVGLLMFAWGEPQSFSERDKRIYTALIQQAAPVIDETYLFMQSQERAERAEQLLKVNTALWQARDEYDITAAVALYSDRQRPALMTLGYLDTDEQGNPVEVTNVAAWKNGKLYINDAAANQQNQLVDFRLSSLWISQPDSVLLIEDMAADPRLHDANRRVLLKIGSRAMAVMPLHSGGRWQGILTIQWAESHVYTDDEKYIYSVLTKTVASVVASHRAYLAAQEARHETEWLYQASRAINAACTFDQVVQAVRPLSDGTQGILLTVWENYDYATASYLEIAAVYGPTDARLTVGSRYSANAFPIAHHISEEGLWVIEDVLHDPRIDPVSAVNLLKGNTRALIGVTLSMNNRWIGSLTVHSSTPRTYSSHYQRLATGIGDMVTAALERIRWQAETEAARQRAERLAELNAALSQATDEWEILYAIAMYTAQIQPDFISLNYVEWDKRGKPSVVTPIAAWHDGQPAPYAALLSVTFRLADFPAANDWANAPDSVLLVPNVATDEHLDTDLKKLLLDLNAQALIFVPLHSGARWQGLVTLSWDNPRAFTQTDQIVCEALIRSVGAVVTSRRAYLAEEKARQETELRVRDLETVAKVTTAAATILDVNELLRTVSDLTKANFNLHGVHVYLLDEGQNDLVLSTGKLETGQDRTITLQSVQSPVARAGLKRRGTIVDGITLPPDFWDRPVQSVQIEEIRSRMAVPMITGDKLIGVLEVLSTEPDRFSPADIRVMSTLADLIAVAVQNARLYQQAQALAVLEERNRLARELHDSVSQALYGIALGTRTARTLLDRDPKQVAEPLNYTLSLAEAALAEMRALIFELRPETLEKEGLITALTKQAASLQTRHGIDVQIDLCEEPHLPLKVKEAIYRIAREALHNTIKHAKASRVNLHMQRHSESISLAICDNGIGFEPSGSFPEHLGLESMRERAAHLNGNFTIDSSPHSGTCIRVDIPLRQVG